jgi:hypothetical protein
MMPRIVNLTACLLAAAPLFAGKRIQMESADLATKGVEQQEMLLDATRFRVNSGNTSMIFLTGGGRSRMLVLDKSRNEYMEMDQQTMDQMGQMLQGMMAQMEQMMKGMPPEQRAMMEQMMKGKMPQMPAAAAAPPTVYAAQGRGSVNGFACTNYEGTRAGQKVAEVCAAQPEDLKLAAADFQVFQKMQEFIKGLVQAMQNSPLIASVNAGLAETGFEGFPVQRTTFVNGQATRREQLKSVTDAAFTDADFSVGNARKTEIPDMSGMMGAGRGRGK